MIAEGLLPPEVVLGHPGLLRACAGITPPGGRFLHFYAADSVRTPEGDLRVLADRTQAPAGAGYALENRIVLGRGVAGGVPGMPRPAARVILPDAARHAGGAGAARARKPAHRPADRRPAQRDLFEQAFLAQYLGIVEGGDLTVRDGRVFLKTLGGLHPVDVILRRLNDDWCDPLELRPESLLGVPGLLQAARDGQVAIAQRAGRRGGPDAGAHPFLPSLCRALLGEELRLGSVETGGAGSRRSCRTCSPTSARWW